MDKNLIEFICENGISANQFLLCWLIKFEETDLLKRYLDIFRFKYSEIEILVMKGFLLNKNSVNEGSFSLDQLDVGEKFNSYFGDKEDMGMELWNTYRSWILIDNVPVSAKSRISVEDLIDSYYKIIKGNIKTHNKVIQTLKQYNTKHQYAEMGIDKFINSRHWTALNEQNTQNSNEKQYGAEEF